MDDITGIKFGTLTPLSYKSVQHKIYWKCLCDCGGFAENLRTDQIKAGISYTCEYCRRYTLNAGPLIDKMDVSLGKGQIFCLPDISSITRDSKVIIKCQRHGTTYSKKVQNLLNSVRVIPGCKACDREASISKSFKAFELKAEALYKGKYDYKLASISYENTASFIDIVCPLHGVFNMKAGTHLQGHQCLKCFYHLTPDTFAEKMFPKHGDFYNYSKVDYKGSHTKVTIICPKHGEFQQTPSSHFQGSGCRECVAEKNSYSFVDRYKIYEEVGKEIGMLYLLRMWSDNEEFLKVGITANWNLRKRGFNKIKEYSYEVLQYWELTNLQTAIVEDRVLYTKKRNGMHYSPLHKFDGRFECVKYEFMKELVDMVEQEIEKAVENSKKVVAESKTEQSESQ